MSRFAGKRVDALKRSVVRKQSLVGFCAFCMYVFFFFFVFVCLFVFVFVFLFHPKVGFLTYTHNTHTLTHPLSFFHLPVLGRVATTHSGAAL
jgi:hypothetical protein